MSRRGKVKFSFLKQRSKKSLFVYTCVYETNNPICKSFLVLFFKKELLLLIFASAQAATVHVMVRNVHNDHGHVLVAVCARADFLRPHCPWQGSAPARLGEVRVDVAGVPPGVYAAEAFHDENDNGRLDRSFFGLPEEGMGFSRDAPMRFGPPDFGEAAFTVAGEAAATITLKYY